MPATGPNEIRILTPIQERFLQAFFENQPLSRESFYLSGGTALAAFYLRHRYSDDLDFFTRDRPLPAHHDRVVATVRTVGLQIEDIYSTPDLARYTLSGDSHAEHPLVKVECATDPPPYAADPIVQGGVLVDHLLCIAVNKLAIHTRFEPKDYVDLYLIVRGGFYRMEDLIPLARSKMIGLDELTLGMKFAESKNLPRLDEFQRSYMIREIDISEMLRFYEQWAARMFELLPPKRE